MKRHSLDLIIVILLFCVYTASALLLCVIGAQVYHRTADTMRGNYDERTSVLYVAEKLRHNDVKDSVRVDKVNGNDALVLIERQSGRNLEVWLFVQDNTLYEGVFASGKTVDTALCQPILPMESMSISMSQGDGRQISITFVTIGGKTNSIDLSLHTSQRPGA